MRPLPRLIAITPSAELASFHDAVERLLARAGNLPLAIMLRDHDANTRKLLEAGHALRALCRAPTHQLLINQRADIALACQADGVHLPTRGMTPPQARQILGPNALIGRSCHNAEESETSDGANYITLSPFASSPGKGAPLDAWERICRQSMRPVYALGGVFAGHVSKAIQQGAYGIASIRGVFDETSVTEILDALHGSLDTLPPSEG